MVAFNCKIGDKVLTGVVKEKSKAKKIFNEAVAKGETAGLLEQAHEAADVFSTKLGNIPAGGSVIVEITYIGELKHHETEGIRFTLPTSIAPRYGPSTALSSTVRQDNGGIEITVDVNMPEGSFIKGIQSPSHPISVSLGTVSTAAQADPQMSKASATLSLGSAALEKDFVLIIQSNDVGIPKAILEIHPTIPNHRAIMATLVPKFSLPPSRPEIVFLADRSGSMAGTSMSMLMSAMKVFLKSMPTGVKFNIGSFGSNYSFLWPQSKSYTSETLQESMAHIETFNANMGGTETFQAVKATIDRRYSDLPLEIILLTDGDIWRQNDIFEYVNQQVIASGGKIRIFPLGIGNGVSHSLIEGLARAGNGFAQAVQSGERLDNSVVRMLRGALSPHITDYTLEVKYEQEDDDFEVIEKVTDGMKVLLSETEGEKKAEPQPTPKATISLFDPSVNPEKDDIVMEEAEVLLPEIPYPNLLQAPHNIPSLFAFSRTPVYLLMSPETIQRNPTSVVLHATSAQGPLELEIPIEALPKPAETIHQLAAKKAIQDLEEGRGWIYDAKDQNGMLIKDRYPSCFEDIVKKETVRLGEKFQVAGKWCSFVAVAANGEEITEKRKASNDDVLQNFDFDSFLAQDAVEDTSSAKSHSRVLKKYKRSAPSTGTAMNSPVPPSQFSPSPSPYTSSLASYQQSLMVLNQQPSRSRRQMGPVVSNAFQNPSVRHQQSSGFGPQQASGFGSQQMQQQQPQTSPFGGLHGNSGRGGSKSGGSPSAPAMSTFGAAASITSPFYGRDASTSGAVKDFAGLSPSPAHKSANLFGASPIMPLQQPAPLPASSIIASPRMNIQLHAASPPKPFEYGRSSVVPLEPVNYTIKWANKSSVEKVLALIELQEFEGSWPEGNEEVGAILGIQIPQVPVQGQDKAWITLLVIYFLDIKNAAEAGTWGLVVEKARDWLTTNVTNDLEHLENAAITIINKY